MAAVFWALLSLGVLCSNGGQSSEEQPPKLELKIAGFFVVNDECFVPNEWVKKSPNFYESVQLMEALRFATEEINRNLTILPGIKLIPNIRFFCQQIRKYEANKMIKFHTIAAVIETEDDFTSDQALRFIQELKIPTISYSTRGLKFWNHPSLLRMVPPAQYQSTAIMDILTHLGWTYVSILASDELGMDEFRKEAELHNICIATSINICGRKDFPQAIMDLQSHPRAKVVVLFIGLNHVKHLLTAARALNASFIWVVGSSWGLSVDTVKKYDKALGPIIAINSQSYPLQRFNAHFQAKMDANAYSITDPEFRSLFSNEFSFPSNHEERNLENSEIKGELPPSPKVMSVVNAVYTIAHALVNILFTSGFNLGSPHTVKYFKEFLRNTTFIAPFLPPDVQYTVKFDGNGNGPARYNIFTIQEMNGSYQQQQIGSWAEKLTLNPSDILWENNMVPESSCGKPCGNHERKNMELGNPCCWVCIKCQPNEALINESTCKVCDPGHWPNTNGNDCSKIPLDYIQWGDGLAIGSICFSCLGILSTIFVGGSLVWNNNTPIVKASAREFCYILLIGVFLLYVMTFIFIARPSSVICSLRRFGLATSFAICYSALLTKTNRITRIFNSAKKGIVQPRYISLTSQLSICLALITCQLLGMLIWLIVDPAAVMESISPDKHHMTVKCRSGDLRLLLSLVYNVLLIILCTVYAFKTRKYPENFNEAKCIGFTMYTTCIIWLASLPVFYVTSDYPKFQVTALCVSISLCAFVILGGLFVPKLYIIFYHPEKNVKSGHWFKGLSHTESSHANQEKEERVCEESRRSLEQERYDWRSFPLSLKKEDISIDNEVVRSI